MQIIFRLIAIAFGGIHLPICLLLHEFFLNVGSVSQLQLGNWPTSSYSNWYWVRPVVSVLVRSWCISQTNHVDFEQMLKLLVNLLIFPLVDTSWGTFNYYVITISQKFLSCLHLHNFGSPFSFIKDSKLCIKSTALPPLVISSVNTKNVLLNVSHVPLYICNQLFRFQLSKLYRRFSQLAFDFKFAWS